MQEQRQRALETLVFKVAGASDQEMLKRTAELVGLYRDAGRYDDALRACRRAESRLSGAGPRAKVIIAAARIMLDDQNKATEAEKEFRRVLKNRGGVARLLLREAQIGLGDVACRRGDAEAARKAFGVAEKTRPAGWQARRNAVLRASSLARYVEEYIRTRDLEAAREYLRTWYHEFPSERLKGQAPLLEARLHVAGKQYRRAVQVVEQLFALNPESPFMPQALLVGVEANLQLNRRDAARKMLRLIVDDYPEFARHKEAVEMLKRLGGSADSPAPDSP
ncbi:MAG: tetratricopeptide repeat protein [Anaerolineaceae bacterium]|nr:tetratricopeptide repeat protein [Anaerolineaceae bacterium]